MAASFFSHLSSPQLQRKDNHSTHGSLLLDDDKKHAEQNVVGPSFALADVYCPFQDGAERSKTNRGAS